MKEKTFWTNRLRPLLIKECQLTRMRGHFERVENAVATGTPDVDFCIAGVPGKIELKYTNYHPVRPGTPVLGRGNGLRRSQVVWIARRLYAGGTVFLAVGTPRATWVINLRGWDPQTLPDLALYNAPRLQQISAWCDVSVVPGTLPRVLTEKRL